MKKLFCILAVASLVGACEQKTEVVTPASQTPNPVNAALQGERPKKSGSSSGSESGNTLSTSGESTKEKEAAAEKAEPEKMEKKDTTTEVTTEVTEKKQEIEEAAAATPNP